MKERLSEMRLTGTAALDAWLAWLPAVCKPLNERTDRGWETGLYVGRLGGVRRA